MKKIYKYATGDSPPEGAFYLSTVTQTRIEMNVTDSEPARWVDCWFVWHYFLVEVED